MIDKTPPEASDHPHDELDPVVDGVGQSLTVSTQGEVVNDYDCYGDYDGGRKVLLLCHSWLDDTISYQPVTAFFLSNAIISKCYTVIDPLRHRLFLNQTYAHSNVWFDLRAKVTLGRYEFSSSEVVPLKGRYVIIGGPVDKAYYHWLLNWCPRLTLFKIIAPELFSDNTLKIMIDYRAAQEPFLSFLIALGIERDRIFFSNDDYDYEVEQAFLVPFLSQIKYYPVVVAEFAAAVKAGSGLQIDAAHGSARLHRRRIFISRQKFTTPKRRIQNFSQISPILDSYGFENILLEDMSVIEQVRMFSQAEAVIGVHGAGLANIIFVPKDCAVVVIDSVRNVNDGISRMFTELARVCSLQYSLIVADEHFDEVSEASDFVAAHNRDIIIKPTVLQGVLEEMLGSINNGDFPLS